MYRYDILTSKIPVPAQDRKIFLVPVLCRHRTGTGTEPPKPCLFDFAERHCAGTALLSCAWTGPVPAQDRHRFSLLKLIHKENR